jgi:hypothetical protein
LEEWGTFKGFTLTQLIDSIVELEQQWCYGRVERPVDYVFFEWLRKCGVDEEGCEIFSIFWGS